MTEDDLDVVEVVLSSVVLKKILILVEFLPETNLFPRASPDGVLHFVSLICLVELITSDIVFFSYRHLVL